MTRPGIEPRSTGPLANTLLTRTMSRFEEKRDPMSILKKRDEEKKSLQEVKPLQKKPHSLKI